MRQHCLAIKSQQLSKKRNRSCSTSSEEFLIKENAGINYSQFNLLLKKRSNASKCKQSTLPNLVIPFALKEFPTTSFFYTEVNKLKKKQITILLNKVSSMTSIFLMLTLKLGLKFIQKQKCHIVLEWLPVAWEIESLSLEVHLIRIIVMPAYTFSVCQVLLKIIIILLKLIEIAFRVRIESDSATKHSFQKMLLND